MDKTEMQVRNALDNCYGSVSMAARTLGVKPAQLERLAQKFNLRYHSSRKTVKHATVSLGTLQHLNVLKYPNRKLYVRGYGYVNMPEILERVLNGSASIMCDKTKLDVTNKMLTSYLGSVLINSDSVSSEQLLVIKNILLKGE